MDITRQYIKKFMSEAETDTKLEALVEYLKQKYPNQNIEYHKNLGVIPVKVEGELNQMWVTPRKPYMLNLGTFSRGEGAISPDTMYLIDITDESVVRKQSFADYEDFVSKSPDFYRTKRPPITQNTFHEFLEDPELVRLWKATLGE